MEIKPVNPKLEQDQKAKELGCSSSTSQPYRHERKLQSPCKSNGSKRIQKTSIDLKRPEMTSKEPLIADSTTRSHSIKPIQNKRSKLTGSDPSDIPIQGGDLIEQAFSSS